MTLSQSKTLDTLKEGISPSGSTAFIFLMNEIIAEIGIKLCFSLNPAKTTGYVSFLNGIQNDRERAEAFSLFFTEMGIDEELTELDHAIISTIAQLFRKYSSIAELKPYVQITKEKN